MTPTRPRREARAPGPDGGNEPAGLVWTRPQTERRERPTRQAIVATAIHLADTVGLDAVSIRRVAAGWDIRAMGLYAHIARKEDLINLRTDKVLRAALLDKVPIHWREALPALARALPPACPAHPWLITPTGQSPEIGPNAMRCLKQSLDAIAELDVDSTKKLAIVRAVTTYAMGHAQVGPARGQMRASVFDREWRASAGVNLQGVTESGAFPHLAAVGVEGLLPDENDKVRLRDRSRLASTGIAAGVGGAIE